MTPSPCAGLSSRGGTRILSRGSHDARAQTKTSSLAQFEVPATLQGQSTFFTVYYDDGFGSSIGAALAAGVLARCDSDYDAIFEIFGSVTVPLPMTCVIVNNADGAHHQTCIDNVIYASGLALAPPNFPDVATALAVLVAEEVEVFSAAQGLGWDCGNTNGEGLSRVLAEELYPGVLDFFHTADQWLDFGRPNFVDFNSGTDQDSLSNGCSVSFLYFLRYVLGYEWTAIVQAGGTTLEETYERLTGQTGGYTALRQCVDALYPPGSMSGLTTDNPFPAFDYYSAAAALL